MRKLFGMMFVLTILSVIGAVAADNYKVDNTKSTVEWLGKKIGGQHDGTVGIQQGNITIDANNLKGGEVIIDMTSIKNKDITDAETNAKLIGHLKSDDFFSVEKFKTAKLVILSAKPIKGAAKGSPNYDITANLTIKGITNKITFKAIVTVSQTTFTGWANIVIDRSKWDVRYGSGSFFDNLGDKVIKDEIEFKVNLVAKK